MNKIDNIEFKKLKRISPSQFYSMKNCTYKSILAEAFERKPLLPISPNAYFGTVLHKILELISKGEIVNETEFNSRFDEEIRLMEEILLQSGYNYFVPLQMNVRDFGMKKIQLKKYLREADDAINPRKAAKFHSENWFESKDKLIGGKMDLVIESGGEIEIIDFKTGRITEDVFDDEGESYQIIKSEYQEQLKLYAYLYFDCKGRFPTHLSLIDLAKQKFIIEFSEVECKSIFAQAKNLLADTNASVDSKVFIANPNETNCKYCLYRPACSFYMNLLLTDNSFNDVCGVITDVVQYQNGNVSVFVIKGNNKITVTGFDKDRFEYFNSSRSSRINLFNLRKEVSGFIYSATRMTMIYE